ncbi:hypothetical protein cce_3033 [Crocosphaera subtropica ATCC 51142]|uniref:Calx-beta domain-containing protein n=1 Tax=Crocosphaera subtropica (strain ATCC 51142 / BH68) TaxID=43989 RepID=B1WW48_CROS5|nr:MucBP domain-containing protein [Crocosphaera subtropica]ACB52381.1 hypothetical protein cce_3033 [Crocosphaera subtropica ATCC 51142]
MTQVSLSTSTNFDGALNALVETLGTALTLRLDLDEPAPEGGLRVFIDSDVEQILNRLDLPTFAFNPVTENISPASIRTDFDNSGIALTISEGATFGSFTIPIFDNAEPDSFLPETFDGLVEATFSVKTADEVSDEDAVDITGISDYTIDPAAATSLVLFADDVSQLPDIGDGDPPVVSFSTTPTVINEADGTALVMEFSVDGEIPEDGITVFLEGDMAEILQQFLAPDGDGAVQTRVTDEGNIFYRFDTSFGPGAGLVGGTLEVFSLEDGDPAQDNSDPEAAGIGFLSNFSFTITEPTASITLPVSDDILQEADTTYTYTLVEGDGYTVDETANSGTFTVTDGVTPATSPTVGVTATPTTLLESEQTVFEITFTTEGDIPADGLVVQLQGPPRAIAEFDVNATNPRLPENETVVEGVVVTGGNIVGTDEVAGSVFFRIFEPTATISVPVFQDDVAEGEETLIFNLQDGELYEIDPDASVINVTIEDGDVPAFPVVSFSTTPEVISEAEGTALVMEFSVDGEIPENGITVNLEGDVARIMQQFTVAQTRFDSETGNIFYRFDNGFVNPDNGFIVGGVLDRFSLEDGDPSESNSDPTAAGDGFLSNFSFTITEPNASITLPVLDDLIEEADTTYTYTLVEGEGYTINSEASTGTFTLTDGVEGGVGPRVEISSTPGTLYESEQTAITINFRTRGEIPPEGVVVFVDGPPRAIAEFDVNATNPRLPEDETVVTGPVVVGGSIVGTNETAGGFFFRVTEEFSSITVPVFQDDVTEGTEDFTFTVLDGEGYQVREGRKSISFTIEDILEPPVVSMSGSPTLLREDEGTVLELNFTTIGDIPASGTTVVLETTDPLLLGTQISNPSNGGDNVGISIPSGSRTTITDEDGNFLRLLQRVTITEANATLRLPVVDDIFEEMDTEYTLTLVEGEGYNLDETGVNSATFTVSDGMIPDEVPTIGVRATPGTLYESEPSILTLTFDVRGEIPEGGIEVFLDSNVARAIAEFDIEGNARTGEVEGVEVTGGEIVGTDNDVSGFFFRIDQANATISVPVFSDDVTEGLETFTFALAEGESYNVRSSRPSVTFSIEDVLEPPVVSMSGSPTLLREDEGTVLELNFTTIGDIPASGTTVVLETTDPLLLGTQISNPSNGGDNVGISIPSGSRTTITDEDGNFLRLLQRVTITEANATLRLPVVDDIFEEMDTEYTLTLIEGEGYNLDETGVNSATFTVSDGELPSNVPTIGVTATPETLVESEQTVLTVSLNAQGEIPEGGVTVFLDSNVARAIAEFDIEGNARTGEVEGVQVTGGEIVGTDNDVSGFFFRMDEANATISVPVFPDDEVEGTETFTYTLAEGEGYAVDPVASSIDFTIEDGQTLPEVSLSITPEQVIEEDPNAAFTATFTVDGEVPEAVFDAEGNYVSGGLSVFLDVKELDVLLDQLGDSFSVEGLTFGPFFDEAQPTVVEFILSEETASITLPTFNDIIEEDPFTFNFELLEDLEGSDYTVNPDANMGSFELVDGNGGPGVGPTVGISIDKTELTEGEEFTFGFAVDGEIPQEGLEVLVTSDTAGSLGEFALFDENGTPLFETTGIDGVPTPADGIGSSFFVTLTDSNASITLSVFEDGPGEGLEAFNFSLVNGEEYEVAPDASDVSFTIDDTPPVVELPVFGSLDGEMFDAGVTPGFDGTDDIVFGGAGDDFIDTVAGNGGNRLYGQSGDDTFILGHNDRAFGGAGDDSFFLLGGDNVVTGGAGSDSFWLAVGEIPEAANTITDFDLEADVLGIAGLGIGFDGLTISEENGDTLIATGDDELAKLLGVSAGSLSADHFVFG